MMPAPVPQDLWALRIPVAAAAPAVAEMGHDRQRRMRPSRDVDEACHARDRELVEDVVGSVDGGEDDPVGEEAAGNVINVCPADAELIAFHLEVLREAIVDFVCGVRGWMLCVSVEPIPIAHDLAAGFLGHAEIFRAIHVGEPDVLEIFVSVCHGVEPDVEMEKEDTLYLGGAIVGRCVEYQLHGVSEGFVGGEGFLERVMGKVELMLVRGEAWHADVYLSEEWFVGH